MVEKYPSRTDIVTAMRNPNISYKASELIGGTVVQKGSKLIQYSGGYTTVFPFHTHNSKKVAIRCWIADIGNAKKRSQAISNYLENLKSSYFCDFKYIDDAILINGKNYPIVMMDWVEAKPLKEFINDTLFTNPSLITILREKFLKMVKYFHQKNISHGDLQHGNLLVDNNANIKVIDYDSMFIKPLNGMVDTIKGLPGYQHPARQNNRFINSTLDYFSELVIYLSLLIFENQPSLWNDYYETEDILFSKNDFENPSQSQLITDLLNSGNSDIRDLIQKLINQLKIRDITKLEPLESLLVSKTQIMKGNIMSKWNKQQNPLSEKIKISNAKNIIGKF